MSQRKGGCVSPTLCGSKGCQGYCPLALLRKRAAKGVRR